VKRSMGTIDDRGFTRPMTTLVAQGPCRREKAELQIDLTAADFWAAGLKGALESAGPLVRVPEGVNGRAYEAGSRECQA